MSSTVFLTLKSPGESQEWGASCAARRSAASKDSTQFDEILKWATQSRGTVCPHCLDDGGHCYWCEERYSPKYIASTAAIASFSPAKRRRADASSPEESDESGCAASGAAAAPAAPAATKSKKGAKATKKPSKFLVGDRVDARWEAGLEWYPGRVIRARRDGSYDIKYDDGDKELKVAEEVMRTHQDGCVYTGPGDA